MTTNFPLVSVIIPAYNAEAFIERTLQSVLSQTYKNIEVLVVDDGSQDSTPEIVKSFAQQDIRVTLFQQKNAGVAAARNLAIEKSMGEYIAPLDADDIWYPKKLEKQVQCMLEADRSVGLVYSWSAFIDEEDVIIGEYNSNYYWIFPHVEGEVYPAMLYTNFLINASSPLIRRACFEKIGGYNCKFKEHNAQGCEDWDIYLRIAEHYQFRVVPEFLIGYRQISQSMSRNCRSMVKSYNLMMADARQRRPEIPSYIYNWSASNFCIFLLDRSIACGDFSSSLAWICKGIKLDYALLLQGNMYRYFIICLLSIVTKLVTPLIWSESYSWWQLKEKIKPSQKVALKQVTTVCEVQKEMQKSLQIPSKRYERMKYQRWLRLVQFGESSSHSSSLELNPLSF